MISSARLASRLLTVSRVLLSAWVGAAILFVINGIRLVTSPELDSVVRNIVTARRFPPYYTFGAICLLGALAAALGAVCCQYHARRRNRLPIFFLITAILLFAYDYWTVYLPLEQMITPPDQPRPAEFVSLHEMSKWINTVHVSSALIAMLLLRTSEPQTTVDPAAIPKSESSPPVESTQK